MSILRRAKQVVMTRVNRMRNISSKTQVAIRPESIVFIPKGLRQHAYPLAEISYGLDDFIHMLKITSASISKASAIH